ncbi:uncharacterized protein EV420DRAFT_249185 [Desarmillaria tabescens]|uniref:Uncharacterized protein n=1 Tax=Armillaria tabescens TaxID=1929756 RepID=A0AA39N799_ARMTA|nr:uncharacterized protein EV420DRAFT_249185 [Desarmillaria tabescens]KAK0460055.1 hypothetical protein EV420DRAFT_249185 [Desarmillaria tabescens]
MNALLTFSLWITILFVGIEPRQLRPRKPPGDGPCTLKEILSAESSLSSIATEITPNVIALLSDNEEGSNVIMISSDSESDSDEDGFKGQGYRTQQKKGPPESDPDVQLPCPKRRRASAIRRHVSSSEGSCSPSPEKPPTKLRRLRRWTES